MSGFCALSKAAYHSPTFILFRLDRDGSVQIQERRKENTWLLYCADHNDKWHLFEPHGEGKDIEKLLAEVERDTMGIFWG